MEGNGLIKKHVNQSSDNKGGKTKICLWNHPGNYISGILVRIQKTAGTMQKVISNSISFCLKEFLLFFVRFIK